MTGSESDAGRRASTQRFVESLCELREAGRSADLAALIAERPDVERELRELWAAFSAIDRVIAGEPSTRAAGGSLAAHIERRFGARADPGIALQARDEPASAQPSGIIERLSGRASASSRYAIEGEIARGGMGAILRVWDEDLRRHLAMKVLLGAGGTVAARDGTPVDSHALARFLEEAQVTGQLDHPGIVPVHELGLDTSGEIYFTMRLVEGRDLRAVFEHVFASEEGWNETRALGVLLKVCEATSYAHARGVIHRDLKPANVMVGRFGEVYVMDWGLARVLGRDDARDLRIRPPREADVAVRTVRSEERDEAPDSPLITVDGAVLGTPAYMPPEQARGEIETLTARADVYAVGAMLYHLLAREMPYVPKGARVPARAVLARVVAGPPRALCELRRDVPAELEAICERAMSREAARRYADVQELAEDLRAFLERRVVKAYETGAWAETKKWVQRNQPLAASLAAAVILLASGLAASLAFKAQSDRNAEVAEERRRESDRNAERARANEARAGEQERIATQKANDVLSLSAIQELKELVARADALWPALPDKLADYDAWLSDAKALIDGRVADPARGIAAHPSLADHQAKLAEIRTRAKPLTAEQLEADRRASPSFEEWERERARLTWLHRMLGQAPWPSESEVETDLASASVPADAVGLDEWVHALIDADPARPVHGNEVKALALARRALAAASETERASIRETLAWALYRSGRLDEALAEDQRAVDEARSEELSASSGRLHEAVALWRSEGARAKQVEEARNLSARVLELDAAVNERATWELEDTRDRWWHAQLSQLVSDLSAFSDPRTGLYSAGLSETYGSGIARRRDEASRIDAISVSGPEAKRLWADAIGAIATSARYGGLVLTPQIGLLPVGEDPDSHAWEFAHLQTGEACARGTDGKLVLKEQTGLVLVLIPGGTFRMGAQRDPSAPNYDPLASGNESPVHDVTLDPYFLSKYEMTQGQWERIAGRNPSVYRAGTKYGDKTCSRLNPVEQVSWSDCVEVLRRVDLVLPTEAQWERGARAGTASAWWTGDEKQSLQGAANLSDASSKAHGGPAGWLYDEWLDDGWTVHASVGSYRANGLGLHDVLGNVWEWCRDGFGGYALLARAGDGERQGADGSNRVSRGGGILNVAALARVAVREGITPDVRSGDLGLRPARAVSH